MPTIDLFLPPETYPAWRPARRGAPTPDAPTPRNVRTPIHPLAARPGPAQRQTVLAATGARPAVHTIFDIDRRPLWVLNNLLVR